MVTITKFFTIMICNNIIFKRSLKLHKHNNILTLLGSSLFVALICFSINEFYSGLGLCFLCTLTPITFMLTHKQDYYITLSTSFLSIAISLVIYYLSIILTIPLALTLGNIMNYNYAFNILSEIVMGVICIFLAYLIFKIKRFSKGFSFLYERTYTDTIITLSVGIIFINIFFRFSEIRSIHLLLLVLAFIVFLFFFLYATTKKQITNSYIHHHMTRLIDSSTHELTILKEEMQHLEYHNNKLSSIIHKDNKLLLAMKSAVTEAIMSENRTALCSILSEINKLSDERSQQITTYERSHRCIANFGDIRLNAIINYMNEFATKNYVDFKFTYVGDVEQMIDNISSENDICTLLADIVENGIISSQHSPNKSVFLSINATPNHYAVSVYDSGNFFDKQVIKKLGKKRVTTRKNSGGSGIGLMTTFELLKKYRASFSIDETINTHPYTKCVSITFDNNFYHTYNNIPL